MLPAGTDQHRQILGEFERCWAWLEASLIPPAYVHNGNVWPSHRKEDVLRRIMRGQAQFWPGEHCAILTEIYCHPSGLKSQNNWLAGGDDLAEIAHIVAKAEDWARAQGCHRTLGSGRRGWLAVFDGYTEIGVRKQKDLLLP